jgi:ADP-ribosylglycohydrolase
VNEVSTQHSDIDHDRALGAYIGAAIGDAMGGPIECQHAARIRRVYGHVQELLPYRSPPGLIELKPGYALRADPGSVTDDTFIRADLTRFYLDTQPPRTTQMLADWMLAHADFRMWWPPAVHALRRVEQGKVTAQEGGLSHRQGGGVGWWTPVGILYAGRPRQAAAEAKHLCRIWKAPLEQDLLSAVQAGVAEGMRQGSSSTSMIQAMLDACGPLAHALLERGIAIGHNAHSEPELIRRLYQTALVDEAPTAADAPLPPPVEPLPDADGFYTSALLAEQIPFALAAFVHTGGEPALAIPQACRLGRDADTIATTVGSWAGALHGESGLPAEWVAAVCQANMPEIDIRGLGERLLAVAA